VVRGWNDRVWLQSTGAGSTERERERKLKIRNERLQERGTGGRDSIEGCDEKVRKCRKRIKWRP
jgi:hypothetical protein